MDNTLTFLIVVILTFTLGIQKSYGQSEVESSHKKTEFGIKTGISKSFFITEGEGEMKTGFVHGLFFNYELSKRFQLQIEGGYTQLGVVSYLNFSGEYQLVIDPINPFEDDIIIDYTYELNSQTTFKNDYITFPILLKYKLGQSGVKLLFGFRFGYLINSKAEWNGEFEFINPDGNDISRANLIDNILSEVYDKIEFRKMDYSLSYGISYNYKDFPIGIEFRGNYGLNNVNNSTIDQLSFDMKNMNFEISLLFRVL